MRIHHLRVVFLWEKLVKLQLSLGPLAQYQFTHNGEPVEDLYVLSVKSVKGVGGVKRVNVETVYVGTVAKQPGLKSTMEDYAKPKHLRPK